MANVARGMGSLYTSRNGPSVPRSAPVAIAAAPKIQGALDPAQQQAYGGGSTAWSSADQNYYASTSPSDYAFMLSDALHHRPGNASNGSFFAKLFQTTQDN